MNELKYNSRVRMKIADNWHYGIITIVGTIRSKVLFDDDFLDYDYYLNSDLEIIEEIKIVIL